jgi:hypothetical protein
MKARLPAAHPGEAADATSWIEQELAGCPFRDRRLGQRLRKLLTHMAGAIGGSIPLACQDWANTKAAYRFLSNPKVSRAISRPLAPVLRRSAARSWFSRTRLN